MQVSEHAYEIKSYITIFAENSLCYILKLVNQHLKDLCLIDSWNAEGAVSTETGCYLKKYNTTEIDWLKDGTLMELCRC